MELFELKISEYIKELGSSSPAPGGGSASALSGAQGAALAKMVAELTLGRPKYAEHFELCENTAKELSSLGSALMSNIEKDAAAYDALSAAFKLPKESEEEKAARKEAVQQATLGAALLPLETMQLALSATNEAVKLCGKSNTNCASDIGVAALMLRSCAEGAKLNVEINIASLSDKAKCIELQNSADDIMAKVAENCEAMLLYAKSCI